MEELTQSLINPDGDIEKEISLCKLEVKERKNSRLVVEKIKFYVYLVLYLKYFGSFVLTSNFRYASELFFLDIVLFNMTLAIIILMNIDLPFVVILGCENPLHSERECSNKLVKVRSTEYRNETISLVVISIFSLIVICII